jgi:hypothetical protein
MVGVKGMLERCRITVVSFVAPVIDEDSHLQLLKQYQITLKKVTSETVLCYRK